MRTEMSTGSSRVNDPRPAGNEGNAYAALIHVALDSAQWTTVIEKLRLCPPFPMRAVITGKHHQGVRQVARAFDSVQKKAQGYIRFYHHVQVLGNTTGPLDGDAL